MRSIRLHPLSLFAGSVLALTAFLAMGQKPVGAVEWEYDIKTDVDVREVAKLAKDGWTFGGYLGTSMKGASSDETLWRRPKK